MKKRAPQLNFLGMAGHGLCVHEELFLVKDQGEIMRQCWDCGDVIEIPEIQQLAYAVQERTGELKIGPMLEDEERNRIVKKREMKKRAKEMKKMNRKQTISPKRKKNSTQVVWFRDYSLDK